MINIYLISVILIWWWWVCGRCCRWGSWRRRCWSTRSRTRRVSRCWTRPVSPSSSWQTRTPMWRWDLSMLSLKISTMMMISPGWYQLQHGHRSEVSRTGEALQETISRAPEDNLRAQTILTTKRSQWGNTAHVSGAMIMSDVSGVHWWTVILLSHPDGGVILPDASQTTCRLRRKHWCSSSWWVVKFNQII